MRYATLLKNYDHNIIIQLWKKIEKGSDLEVMDCNEGDNSESKVGMFFIFHIMIYYAYLEYAGSYFLLMRN